jgi:hypothetical protein
MSYNTHNNQINVILFGIMAIVSAASNIFPWEIRAVDSTKPESNSFPVSAAPNVPEVTV